MRTFVDARICQRKPEHRRERSSRRDGRRATSAIGAAVRAVLVERLEDRRLLAVGDLDPTFGTGGKAIVTLGDSTAVDVLDVVMRPDGKFFVSAKADANYLVRFNANGSLDTTFGNGGKVVVPTALEQLQLRPDGDVLAVSAVDPWGGQTPRTLYRFNSDGSLDGGFGNGGSFTADWFRGFGVQADGKVLTTWQLNDEMTVRRYHVNGTLDTSFGGGDGLVTLGRDVTYGGQTYDSEEYGVGVGVQPGGKILVGGASAVEQGVGGPDGRPYYKDFVFARLHPDGSLDTTYGEQGFSAHTAFSDEASVQDFVVFPDGAAAMSGNALPYPDNVIQVVDAEGRNEGWHYTFSFVTHDMATRSLDHAVGVAAHDYDSPNNATFTVGQENSGADFRKNFFEDVSTAPLARAATYTPDGLKLLVVGNVEGFIGMVRVDAGAPQLPFDGTPANVGEVVQYEDFDHGGEGISFHDATATNEGGAYRSTGVDIKATTDAGGGHFVGWTQAGEWLEWTIDIPAAGVYTMDTRAATSKSGAAIDYQIGSVLAVQDQVIPNTGSFFNFTTVRSPEFKLFVPGKHVVRVLMDPKVAISGGMANFNWFRLNKVGELDRTAPTAPGNFRAENTTATSTTLRWTASTDNVALQRYHVIIQEKQEESTVDTRAYDLPADRTQEVLTDLQPDTVYEFSVYAVDTSGNVSPVVDTSTRTLVVSSNQTPFKGAPFAVGTTIQVEDFDNGGQGVAYSDRDVQNRGTSSYRSGTGVDLYVGASGINAGYVQPGEWLEYTITVPTGAIYDLSARVSQVAEGARFHFEVDGQNVTGAIAVPNTGSWNSYVTVKRQEWLSAGTHVLRLSFDTAASNGSVGNYDWVRIDRTSTQAPATPTLTSARALSGDKVLLEFPAVPAETRYDVFRNEGGGWDRRGSVEAGATSWLDDRVQTSKTYQYHLQAINAVAASDSSNVVSVKTGRVAGFDINTTGGSTEWLNPATDLWRVKGRGADIHGYKDQFHFAAGQQQGDFDVAVRLNSLVQTDPWAKAGLMARASYDADAPNVAILQSAANGPRFQVRSQASAWTTTSGTGTKAVPTELRLRRIGNTFIGYQRQNGAWVEIGRTTLALPEFVLLGLAVTSHTNAATTTAEMKFIPV